MHTYIHYFKCENRPGKQGTIDLWYSWVSWYPYWHSYLDCFYFPFPLTQKAVFFFFFSAEDYVMNWVLMEIIIIAHTNWLLCLAITQVHDYVVEEVSSFALTHCWLLCADISLTEHFLTAKWHSSMISSRNSAIVSTENPIHSPSWPPMSDTKATSCWRNTKQLV